MTDKNVTPKCKLELVNWSFLVILSSSVRTKFEA